MQTGSRRQPVILPTLRGYQRSWLGADIVAGLSAGAVVIPQAMAYATIANMPVEIGVYTCILPMLVYAFLGGSRAMSVSTTSTIATLSATTLVTAGVAAGSHDAERDVFTLSLLVGIILLVARLFNVGSLVENINKATLIGIKVGLGATVALGQVPKLLGVDVQVTGHGFIRTVIATVEAVPQANLATVLLSLGTIAVLLLFSTFLPRVPGPLVVVALGILLVVSTPLTDAGVALIAPVPSGIPAPLLPSFDNLGALIPGALAIAIMAFLESASVARGIRKRDEPQIDSNQELLATGASNLIGAFFHSLPSAGGFSQSAVNQRAGARTQLSSVVTAVLAVLVLLVLAPVLSNLPQATLAAMVVVAVAGLIDIPGMVRLARISRVDFWISAVTAAIGLALGLLPAVAAGVVLTLGMVLRELNRVRLDVSQREDGTVVIAPRMPFYTANLISSSAAITAAIDGFPGATMAELDLSHQQVLSVSVLDGLAELDSELAEAGVLVVYTRLPAEAAPMAEKTAWWRTVHADGRASA